MQHRDTTARKLTLRLHPFTMERIIKRVEETGSNKTKIINDLIKKGMMYEKENSKKA